MLNITIAEEKYFVSFDWNTLNVSNSEDHCFKKKITARRIYSQLTINNQCFTTNSLGKIVLDAQAELKNWLLRV